jgi:hypothetical protein
MRFKCANRISIFLRSCRGVFKHELVVNLRTAHHLGLTIPDALMKRADLLIP